jgi:threonine/homoserine/homoserine lactone efflux protein
MSGFGADLALFAAAFAVAIASPGPFAAALVARGMAFGFPSAAGMAVGGLAGDLIFVSIALFGLALIAAWADLLIVFLRYVGAAWLIWLGLRLLTARDGAVHAPVPKHRGFLRGLLAGATLGLGNPKAALFYTAVFPGFFTIPALTATQVATIYAVIVAILLTGHLLWAATAARAGQWLDGTRAVTLVNRVSGGVLSGAGVAIAAS